MLGGGALIWITVWRKQWSPITAPLYALAQGAVVGVISSVGLDNKYPGIALRAVGLTVLICVCLLSAYRFHLIRVTDCFNRKLSIAISAVGLYYLVTLLIAFKWGFALSNMS